MAVTETPRHGLKKQDKGDNDWHQALNQTLDIIDQKLIETGARADRPDSGNDPQLYYATDTRELFFDTGFEWKLLSVLFAESLSPSVTEQSLGDGGEIVMWRGQPTKKQVRFYSGAVTNASGNTPSGLEIIFRNPNTGGTQSIISSPYASGVPLYTATPEGDDEVEVVLQNNTGSQQTVQAQINASIIES